MEPSQEAPEDLQHDTSIVATLEIRDASKTFHNDVFKKPQKVVENLSLTFTKGLCTGLLGHNGAGKTTTIRMIFGLIRPDSGSILFEGKPITTESKRFIGYMPEINKLPLSLTVEEVLHKTIALYGLGRLLSRAERRNLMQTKIESLGLESHRSKKVGQLSKGLARRLAFAQATIHEPHLLVLDEPSTGLDPNAAETLIEHIEMEKQRGTTIILCTHDLSHINTICDAFYLMRKGRLVGQSKGIGTTLDVEQIDWGASYGIQVSGVSEEVLTKLHTAHHLPRWTSMRLEGQAATLAFDEYQSAAKWLAIFLNSGYLVLRFGDGRGLTGTQIRNFFKGQI